jgi:L-asparaginase II
MTLHETAPVAATVYRGEAIENTHLAHVAVVDASGRLLYSFGDPARWRCWKPARSNVSVSTKPISR